MTARRVGSLSSGQPTCATDDGHDRQRGNQGTRKPTAGPRRVRIPMVRLLRPPEHIAPLHLGLRDSSRPEAGGRNSADPRIDGEQRNRRVRPSEETPSPHFHSRHTADHCPHGRDGAPRKDNGTSTDRFGTHGVTFANVGRDAGVTRHGRPGADPSRAAGARLCELAGLGRNRVSHKSMSTVAPWSPADLVGSCRKPRSSRTPPWPWRHAVKHHDPGKVGHESRAAPAAPRRAWLRRWAPARARSGGPPRPVVRSAEGEHTHGRMTTKAPAP